MKISAAKIFLLILALLGLGTTKSYAVNPCPNSVIQTIVVSGSTLLVSGPNTNNTAIHICMIQIQMNQGSIASNFQLVSGTGATCSTNTISVTPLYTGVATASQFYNFSPPTGVMLDLPVNTSLCLNLSTAPTSAIVQILYTTSAP
jgi:hypothetical protein